MAQLEDLEEPNGYADLGMRLAIIAILIIGLVILSTSAYGSVEDLSGPATAPPTVTTVAPERAEAEATAQRAPQSTLSLEAVPETPPIRVLTPEELAVVESESVEETDGGRIAPTGAADETPATLPAPDSSTDADNPSDPDNAPGPDNAGDPETDSPSPTVPDAASPEPSGPTVPKPTSAEEPEAPSQPEQPAEPSQPEESTGETQPPAPAE